jgi:hypothetical protein
MVLAFVCVFANHKACVEFGYKSMLTMAFKRAGRVHAKLNVRITIVERAMTFVYILNV